MAKNHRRRRERLEQIAELDGQHGFRPGHRDQRDPSLDDQSERPFRPDDQLGQIETVRRADELIKVVAADAAEHLRETAIDFAGTVGRDLADRAVAAGFQTLAGAGRRQVRRSQRPEVSDLTVGQHNVQLEHMIDGLAVENRPRTARIVRDHATDRRAAGRRHIGREPQAVWPELRVQLVEDDAGLDAGPAFGDVHLQDMVEVLRRIDLESGTDRLPGLRRSSAACGHRASVPPRDPDRSNHVLARADDDDADRFNLIDAGVRGVQRA